MKFILKIVLTTISLFSATLTAQGQTYPNYTSLYVNDFANIIDEETESRITQTLRAAKQDRDLEVTVVTILSRNDYGDSPSIESFATGLFNAWGIGNPDRNDGILILVAKEDRDMRIELGRGYPPRFDDRAKNVIENYFLPAFRKNQYAEGIEYGTAETLKRMQLEFGPDNRATLTSRIQNETDYALDNAKSGGLWAWILGALGLAGSGIGFRLFRRFQRLRPRKCDLCHRSMRRLAETDEDEYLNQGQLVEEAIKSKDYDVWYCAYDERTRIEGYRKWFTGFATCPSCNFYTLHSQRRTVIAATTSSTGQAEVTYDCRNCDHHKVETVTIAKISKSSSSSSSGGSSFSGGSSSGGGASGSW